MDLHHKIRILASGRTGAERERYIMWLLLHPNQLNQFLAGKMRRANRKLAWKLYLENQEYKSKFSRLK